MININRIISMKEMAVFSSLPFIGILQTENSYRRLWQKFDENADGKDYLADEKRNQPFEEFKFYLFDFYFQFFQVIFGGYFRQGCFLYFMHDRHKRPSLFFRHLCRGKGFKCFQGVDSRHILIVTKYR